MHSFICEKQGVNVIEIKNRYNGDIIKTVDAKRLAEANLYEADLCRANLCGADLCGANLCGADLCGANLYKADLCGADLCGADLCKANLYKADLCGADLCGADLYKADLCGADLCGADLYKADLCGADLRGANLYEADLRGVNLQNCKGVLSFTCEKHLGFYFKHADKYYFKIGCITNTSDWWIENFESVGKKEGYSEEHIRLYGEIIKLYSSYDITDE
jgi:hypothetical protein